MDLTTLTDEELAALRVDVLTEQERRSRTLEAPAQISELTRQAIECGIDPDILRDALETGIVSRTEGAT